MITVLVVDDEPAVRFTLSEILSERGYRVLAAGDLATARAYFDEAEVILTDYAMPGGSGLDLIAEVKARDAAIPIIIITAHGSERIAADAIKRGAYDYITKPFELDELLAHVRNAHELRALRTENRHLAAERALGRRIIGQSPAMLRVLEQTRRVAQRDITVLVQGETGTGKELIGELLHVQSARARKPFVRFNCAALPADLAESELFGHVRGAFTGATSDRDGYFAQADGGTLILDEVGELPLAIQAKLLRALQNGELQPVGGSRIRHVDVRVVAATNRDLRAEVAAGRFREDLYYRLAVVELFVPPLRERTADIAELAEEFARRASTRFAVGPFALSADLVNALVQAAWPGNVRQLENTITKMAALAADTTTLTAANLHATMQMPPRYETANDGNDAIATHNDNESELPGERPPWVEGLSLREQVETFERGLITRALQHAAGNQSQTARMLGISRVTLIDKLRKYQLTAKRDGAA